MSSRIVLQRRRQVRVARFSSYAPEGGADDAERKTSAPAKLKSRKDSLAGLTKEEKLAKRKASMTAGDSWADLHGTKDRPPKQFQREEQHLQTRISRRGSRPTAPSTSSADDDSVYAA